MDDHVIDRRAGRDVVDRDGLRWRNRIGCGNVRDHAGRDVAIGGQRRIVNLDGLSDVHQRGARRHRHRERRTVDRADGSQHAVAAGLNHFVQEGAELFHAVGHFAFRGIFNGFVARVRGVLDELGDFHGEPEKNRRNLRDVVLRTGTASQIAAVGIVASGFSAGIYLQWQAHVTRADFFDVAALLDHAE